MNKFLIVALMVVSLTGCKQTTSLDQTIKKCFITGLKDSNMEIPKAITSKIEMFLVGEYEAFYYKNRFSYKEEKDSNSYLRINEDGTFTISIPNRSAKKQITYTDKEMDLKILYYDNDSCLLNFRNKIGNVASVDLYYDYYDDAVDNLDDSYLYPYWLSFTLYRYNYETENVPVELCWDEEGYEFKKINQENVCQSTMPNVKEKTENSPVIIVETPEKDVITNQVAEFLVGKYTTKKNPKIYFEIKKKRYLCSFFI